MGNRVLAKQIWHCSLEEDCKYKWFYTSKYANVQGGKHTHVLCSFKETCSQKTADPILADGKPTIEEAKFMRPCTWSRYHNKFGHPPKCVGCHTIIRPGQRYYTSSWSTKRKIQSLFCPECNMKPLVVYQPKGWTRKKRANL